MALSQMINEHELQDSEAIRDMVFAAWWADPTAYERTAVFPNFWAISRDGSAALLSIHASPSLGDEVIEWHSITIPKRFRARVEVKRI